MGFRHSFGHLVHFKIALRGDAEGVGYAVEEGEHCRDVDRFSDLGLSPTALAQKLYIFRGCAIGCLGHLGDVFEQCPVGVVERCVLEVAFDQCLYCFLFCSLNTQEVSMRVESIGTAIQPGDPAGDRLLCPSREMAFREVDRVAEAHHLAQKIWAVAKTFENARHLLASRMGPPFVVYFRDVASRFSILNHLDFCLCVFHGSNGHRVA